jgi:glycosyltransferase involved in cell wall biosynthesis
VKLIIQIPCLNEAKTLPATLADLPESIPGIETIEVQIIDDGSVDGTADVARVHGVKHIVSMGSNRGLAKAFAAGVAHAISLGADIVVNTDADNQYCGEDIAKLIPPILENQADIVVGCRPILEHPEFTPVKKALQLAGSWALRKISRTTVRDAPSGFRAFSRLACQRLFIHSTFSYCIETLVQAGNTGLRVKSVDIRVNPQTRPSRLFNSIPQYLKKQVVQC